MLKDALLHLFLTLKVKDAECSHKQQKIVILILSLNNFIELYVVYILYARNSLIYSCTATTTLSVKTGFCPAKDPLCPFIVSRYR